MKIQNTLLAALGCLCLLTTALHAQVPSLINYQGRITAGTPPVNFNGTGYFKFALVNAAGDTAYWSNDGSLPTTPGAITSGSQPTAAVPLTVTNGLYSVLLGDASPPLNMAAITASVWINADVRLRVWFGDGTPTGTPLLTPDQRLAPNGYLPDGSVSSAAIASGAVTSAKIATGAVTNTQLAANAVQAANIAAGAVGSTQLGAGAVGLANIVAGAVGNSQIANGAVTTAKLGGDVGLWSVSGANVFRSGGNVGIGTIAPEARLHVAGTGLLNGVGYGTPGLTIKQGTGSGAGWVSSHADIAVTDADAAYLALSGTNGSGIYLGGNGATPEVSIDMLNGTGIRFVTGFNTQVPLTLLNNGNVGIGTTEPQDALQVSGLISARSSLPNQGFVRLAPGDGTYAGFLEIWGATGSRRGFLGYGSGVTLHLENGSEFKITGGNVVAAGEITSTVLNITSDRNAKEQFKPVNSREVLDKVARLPISEWQYKTQSDARHIGPMAQDFREAFALGRDDRHITSVDADGVALSAIQGLNEKLEEQLKDKDTELSRLKSENQTLAERLAAVERALGLRGESTVSEP